MAKGNFLHKLYAAGPLLLLYYWSISENEANLEKVFGIFSFNLQFFSLLINFSDVAISYSKIGYNTFFTLFLFPVFWLLFNIYQITFMGGQDA